MYVWSSSFDLESLAIYVRFCFLNFKIKYKKYTFSSIFHMFIYFLFYDSLKKVLNEFWNKIMIEIFSNKLFMKYFSYLKLNIPVLFIWPILRILKVELKHRKNNLKVIVSGNKSKMTLRISRLEGNLKFEFNQHVN